MPKSDTLRIAGLAGAAVGQVALPILLSRRIQTVTAPTVPRTDVMPAPGTFAIWLPIFAGSLGLAGYYALTRSTVVRRVSAPAAAAFAATAAWAPLAATRRFWAAQTALVAIAGLASRAALGVAQAERDGEATRTEAAVAGLPLGMLAAWGTAASGVNLVAMLKARGTLQGDRREPAVGLGALAALGLMGRAVLTAAGPGTTTGRAYAGTLIWALLGIAVGQRRRPVRAWVAPLAAAAPVVGTLLADRSPRS